MDIKRALELKGISMRSLRATVFSGDGKQSYLRCSFPRSYIGHKIVNFIKAQGGLAEYSSFFILGLSPEHSIFTIKEAAE